MLDIAHAVTEYDRKQAGKKGYNIWALGHYMKACQDVRAHVANGVTLRDAIIGCFNGRLCDHVLKSQGLAKMTDAEARHGKRLPELADA